MTIAVHRISIDRMGYSAARLNRRAKDAVAL
ncbi:hypothetical protein J2Z50_000880 [Ensifer mexicanus]|nr:hypothetical protein [Sinorhizobium mexicanum]